MIKIHLILLHALESYSGDNGSTMALPLPTLYSDSVRVCCRTRWKKKKNTKLERGMKREKPDANSVCAQIHALQEVTITPLLGVHLIFSHNWIMETDDHNSIHPNNY